MSDFSNIKTDLQIVREALRLTIVKSAGLPLDRFIMFETELERLEAERKRQIFEETKG